jgi:hypothetical protein
MPRVRLRAPWPALLLSSGVLLAAPMRAAAQEVDQESGDQSAEERTAAAAQAGMFLPFTEAPRVDTQRAFATAQGGYEGARESGVLEGRAEVTVWGPIAVRVGVMYTGVPDQLRPTAGARVQALSQTDHGVDMSIGAFYKPEGFTEGEGEIEGVVALGRRFGRVGLIADLVYGQDPEGRERDGEVRLSGLYDLSSRFLLGLDSRMRFDLGTEDEKFEEEGAAEFDLVAGPLVGYVLGPVEVSAVAGVSVVGTDPAQAGPVLLASLSGTL